MSEQIEWAKLQTVMPYGPGETLLALINAWCECVGVLQDVVESGENLTDETVHDLVGDLFLRDAIRAGLRSIGLGVLHGDEETGLALVDLPDRVFKRLLVDDPGGVLRRAVGDDMTDGEWAARDWWWRGIVPGIHMD